MYKKYQRKSVQWGGAFVVKGLDGEMLYSGYNQREAQQVQAAVNKEKSEQPNLTNTLLDVGKDLLIGFSPGLQALMMVSKASKGELTPLEFAKELRNLGLTYGIDGNIADVLPAIQKAGYIGKTASEINMIKRGTQLINLVQKGAVLGDLAIAGKDIVTDIKKQPLVETEKSDLEVLIEKIQNSPDRVYTPSELENIRLINTIAKESELPAINIPPKVMKQLEQDPISKDSSGILMTRQDPLKSNDIPDETDKETEVPDWVKEQFDAADKAKEEESKKQDEENKQYDALRTRKPKPIIPEPPKPTPVPEPPKPIPVPEPPKPIPVPEPPKPIPVFVPESIPIPEPSKPTPEANPIPEPTPIPESIPEPSRPTPEAKPALLSEATPDFNSESPQSNVEQPDEPVSEPMPAGSSGIVPEDLIEPPSNKAINVGDGTTREIIYRNGKYAGHRILVSEPEPQQVQEQVEPPQQDASIPENIVNQIDELPKKELSDVDKRILTFIQTYPNLEVSSDKTIELIQDFSIRHPEIEIPLNFRAFFKCKDLKGKAKEECIKQYKKFKK